MKRKQGGKRRTQWPVITIPINQPQINHLITTKNSQDTFSSCIYKITVPDNILASPGVEEVYDNKCKQTCDHFFSSLFANPTPQFKCTCLHMRVANTQHGRNLKKSYQVVSSLIIIYSAMV